MGGEGDGAVSSQDEAVRPPAWAGVVTVLLVGVMVVAFVAPVRFHLWPATSWELFSRARGAEQVGATVDLVADDGTVAPLPFTALGPEHESWRRVAARLPAATSEARQRTCESWAEAAEEALGGEAVGEVRAYRVVYRAADEAADPPVVTRRDLIVRCGPS